VESLVRLVVCQPLFQCAGFIKRMQNEKHSQLRQSSLTAS
jgi:hypothetical protein